ncbi:hypothetical protein JCGZ_26584 [Jatropha curcas]|uniref:Uncharacterized protein n=1 Tax=Jatropha curcas TaxID=180498 RepID=A0A067L4E0_JATCU|nr:hypothetical protein JCGZ_26584 [Jatropha curcas]
MEEILDPTLAPRSTSHQRKCLSRERYLEIASVAYEPEDSEGFKTPVASVTVICASARSTPESQKVHKQSRERDIHLREREKRS